MGFLISRCAAFALLFALLASPGCASFSSTQTDTLQDGTIRETRIKVRTLFDGHNDMTKLRASTTDKTMGLSLAGLDQSASSTNAVEVLRLIAAIVAVAAK